MTDVSREAARAEEVDTKEQRLAHPSGVLHLTQHDAVPIMLDAVLDLPPNREFTRTEFADHAGVTRQTVSTYVPLLVETQVFEPVPDTSPERFRVAESPVVAELRELNAALNAAANSSENE